MTEHRHGSLSDYSRSVAGLVVLVTGAGSGMGRATARLFAAEGAKVAVTDVDEASAASVADEITAVGATARAWAMDVTSSDDVDRVVAELTGAFGGLDVVVNNAGIATFAAIDSAEFPELWGRALDVLLTGQTRVIRAALPHLRASSCPRIINIASTEGWGATKFAGPYTAAKHGVVGLTKSMAVELGREAITVNCVCPGPIDTAMTASIPNQDKRTFAHRRTALGRYGQPEEVAHATLNFALPASGFMTGAVLPVDGGLLIKNA